jgi:hydroxycarboxylate dehydrogenase B
MKSPTNVFLLPPDDLIAWVTRVFAGAGCGDAEARTIARSLVQSNLYGHDSHGVGLLPMYLESLRAGTVRPGQSLRVVNDHGAMLTLDGQRGWGQVVARQAMALAVERAQAHGCAVVGLHNAHHIARIGEWAEQCARAGLTSVHFVNVLSPPMVAPWGGSEARLVTNPFCVGVSHEPHPFVLDYATSAIAVGKAKVALARGELVPAGSLIDAAGAPTTNPAALFDSVRGALLPFAQHKGYALAVMCELLGGMMSGGEVQHDADRPSTINNMLSLVFAGDRLCDPQRQREQSAALENWVKSARRSDPAQPILFPGEPERQTEARRRRDGIPIALATVDALLSDAAKLGVQGHPFTVKGLA